MGIGSSITLQDRCRVSILDEPRWSTSTPTSNKRSTTPDRLYPASNIVFCQRILESPAVFPMFTNDLLGDPILIALTFREG